MSTEALPAFEDTKPLAEALPAFEDTKPVITPPQGGVHQRLRAYHEALRAEKPEAAVGAQAQLPGGDLSGERNAPEQIGEDWRQVREGAKAFTFGLGAVGDLEGLGRQAVNKLTPWSPSLKPEDQIVPPTSEGGVLGPRGIGGIGGSRMIEPPKDEREAKNRNVGAQFVSLPFGGLMKPVAGLAGTALKPVLNVAGRGLNAAATGLRDLREMEPPPSPRAVREAELAKMNEALKQAQAIEPEPPPSAPEPQPAPVAVQRGEHARLLPADVPHTLPPGTGTIATSGVGPARAGVGAAGASGPLAHTSMETLRRFKADLEEQGINSWVLDQKLAEMSSQQFGAELTPSLRQELQRLNTKTGDHKNVIHDTVTTRHAEQPERLNRLFDAAFGDWENIAKRTRDLTEEQKANQARYKAFEDLTIPPTQVMRDMLPDLEREGVLKDAKLWAERKHVPFDVDKPESFTGLDWDLIKKALDTKIEGSLGDHNKKTAHSRYFTDLKKTLVKELDNHPAPGVAGVYKAAREGWANPEKLKDAYEFGKKLMDDSVDANELPYLLETHSGPELEAVAAGQRYNLKHRMGRPGPQGSRTINAIMGDNNESKIRQVIGDEKADALNFGIKHEHDMHPLKADVTGGSMTRFGQDLEGKFDAQPTVAEKAGELAGEAGALYHNPKKTVGRWAKNFVSKKQLAKAEARAQKFRREYSDLLLLQGPERDAAYRWIVDSDLSAKANGGRVIKRAEGGRAEITTREFPRVDRHDLRASVPLRPGLDLTGSAYAVPEVNGAGAPVSMGRDWGATIGVRKGFAEGGLTDWVDRGEAGDAQEARDVAAHRLARSAVHPNTDVSLEPYHEDRPPEFVRNIGSDYREGVQQQQAGAGEMYGQGLENMKSGNPLRMGLGAAQDVLAPALGVMAPVGGVTNAITKGFGRIGPGMEHAADVATMVNPDTAMLKAAPLLAHTVIPGSKAGAKAAMLKTAEKLGAKPEEAAEAVKPSPLALEEAHPSWIDQRLPTSKKEIPDEPGRIVDLEAMKRTPDLYKNNVDLVRGYVNTPANMRSAGTDKVAEGFIDHLKNNLLWLHDQVPSAVRDRSQLWYEGGRKIIDDWSKQYGLKDSSIAGVIAAMSPQQHWYHNVSLAQRVLDTVTNPEIRSTAMTPGMEAAFKNSGLNKPSMRATFKLIKGKSLDDIEKMSVPADTKDTMKAVWVRIYDQAHRSPSVRVVSPEGEIGGAMKTQKGADERVRWGSAAEISKAIKAIEANGDAATLGPLMGEKHKVRNFYNNLLDPHSKRGDVTIDTHAVAAGLLRPLSGTDLEVNHNFNNYAGKDIPGTSGSALTGIQGTYPLYAEAYRRAAAERGLLPRQMQSITWEAARGLFPDTFKNVKNKELLNNIWRKFRSGKASLDETRSAILKATGGIQPPDWFRPGDLNPEVSGRAGNAAELHRSGIRGPGADAGAADRTAAGSEVTDLGARREQKQLQGFHKEFMGAVAERAQQSAKVAREYHESGKLPMKVGDRFTTNHSREQQLLPWTVKGHYVDRKNPDKYGYYAERGKEGEEGWERSQITVNDPKNPRLAELAKKFQLMTGPRVVKASGGAVIRAAVRRAMHAD